MQVIRFISLVVLLTFTGFSYAKISAMQTRLNELQHNLVEKNEADKETTRRTEDVERDFRLIRDKLNI